MNKVISNIIKTVTPPEIEIKTASRLDLSKNIPRIATIGAMRISIAARYPTRVQTVLTQPPAIKKGTVIKHPESNIKAAVFPKWDVFFAITDIYQLLVLSNFFPPDVWYNRLVASGRSGQNDLIMVWRIFWLCPGRT